MCCASAAKIFLTAAGERSSIRMFAPLRVVHAKGVLHFHPILFKDKRAAAKGPLTHLQVSLLGSALCIAMVFVKALAITCLGAQFSQTATNKEKMGAVAA